MKKIGQLPAPPETPPLGLPEGSPQITKPGISAPGVKVQRPIGTPTFAFLNNLLRHPLMQRGQDLSGGVWGKILQNKKKGMGNG